MLIVRNPFARTELHKKIIRTTDNCSWCGNNKKGKLFQYHVEKDSIANKTRIIPNLFCSIGCMRNYHNLNF